MLVLDWLQTSEFVRSHYLFIVFSLRSFSFDYLDNSERVILYCLCGYLVGLSIILFSILFLLCLERRQIDHNDQMKMKSTYQIPRQDLEYDVLANPRSYLPVYRYDGRTPNAFYHV